MFGSAQTEAATIGASLVDEAYLAWVSAEIEAEQRLQDWFLAAADGRQDAYHSYRAALDREEASARDLERSWRLALACQRPR
jgi:hypothetical protein